MPVLHADLILHRGIYLIVIQRRNKITDFVSRSPPASSPSYIIAHSESERGSIVHLRGIYSDPRMPQPETFPHFPKFYTRRKKTHTKNTSHSTTTPVLQSSLNIAPIIIIKSTGYSIVDLNINVGLLEANIASAPIHRQSRSFAGVIVSPVDEVCDALTIG